MWIGSLEMEFLLGDVHSLKQKRSVVRPIVAEIKRRFEVAAAETGNTDVYRRTTIGVAAVSADHDHLVAVLDAVDRLAASRPEVELLSVRRRILSSADLD